MRNTLSVCIARFSFASRSAYTHTHFYCHRINFEMSFVRLWRTAEEVANHIKIIFVCVVWANTCMHIYIVCVCVYASCLRRMQDRNDEHRFASFQLPLYIHNFFFFGAWINFWYAKFVFQIIWSLFIRWTLQCWLNNIIHSELKIAHVRL